MSHLRRLASATSLLATAATGLIAAGPRPESVRAALADPTHWAERVGPDAAAITVAGVAGWLVLLWVSAGLLLTAATALPGSLGRLAEAAVGRTLPGPIRRVAAILLGVSITAAVASCAQPTTPPAAASSTAAAPDPTRPVPAPLDRSAATTGQLGAAGVGAPAHHSRDSVSIGPSGPAGGQPRPDRTGSPRAESPSPTVDGRSARAGTIGDDVDWPLTASVPSGSGRPQAPAGRQVGLDRPQPKPVRPGSAAAAADVDWPLGDGAATARLDRRHAGDGTAVSRPAGRSGRRDRAAGTASAGRVVVTAGDCLWLLAAHRLGAGARAGEIAIETRRWYDANAAVIGPDPDLLRPGQRLVIPP